MILAFGIKLKSVQETFQSLGREVSGRPLRGSEARVPPRLASKGKIAGSSIVSAFPGVWLAWETAATLPPAGTWEEKSVLA